MRLRITNIGMLVALSYMTFIYGQFMVNFRILMLKKKENTNCHVISHETSSPPTGAKGNLS